MLYLVLISASTGCEATPEPTATLPIWATPSPTTLPVTPTATTTATPRPSITPIPSPQATVPLYTYRVIQTYPHDPEAFTQGLVYYDGVLYEGTGLWGRSSLRKAELSTGQVLQMRVLPERFFGEGITIWRDRILQLTWQSQVGFVYDRESFELLGEFSYDTEGWGLTHDGTRLIMSDGSATLRFLDPETLQQVETVTVRAAGQPVTRLNELEYVRGEVYANVWQTDQIARIAPATGQVLGWIDLTGLLPPADRQYGADVLNGIAYDSVGNRLFVTGKWWPKLFEIEVLPQEATDGLNE